MPILHKCDNPHCSQIFAEERTPIYCLACEPINREWKMEQGRRATQLTADFAKEIESERAEFFRQRTPVTRRTNAE